MQVECIKDTIHFKKWQIFWTETEFICSKDWTMYSYEWNKYPEYFQELEEKKPIWKVGDKVARDDSTYGYPFFSKIATITIEHWKYVYYIDWLSESIDISKLRNPTLEENKLYFR